MPAAGIVADAGSAVAAPVADATNDLLPIVTQLSQDVQTIQYASAAILALLLVATFLYFAVGWFK